MKHRFRMFAELQHKGFHRLMDGRKLEIGNGLTHLLHEDGKPTFEGLENGAHKLVGGEILHVLNGYLVDSTFQNIGAHPVAAKMEEIKDRRKKGIAKLRKEGKI